jgi:hypothetical protein
MTEEHTRWTYERVALLGYLVGSGRKVEAAAEELGVTAGDVYRQAARFGLSFRASPAIGMTNHTYRSIQMAARRRGIDTATLVNRVLKLLGADATLLENCIDDDASHTYFAGFQ